MMSDDEQQSSTMTPPSIHRHRHHNHRVVQDEAADQQDESEDYLLLGAAGGPNPTTFSQLLCSHDIIPAASTPMPCFGPLFSLHATTSTPSPPLPLVSTKSSSPPPTNNNNEKLGRSSTARESNSSTRKRASKKSETVVVNKRPTSAIPKARKEKVGERIATLQQLVSPFGKTDTASVLHEAMGYIRFLQDQVQVLCSPYLLLHDPPAQQQQQQQQQQQRKRRELKSRGLCLVPVDWTMHLPTATINGADLWSPASTTTPAFPCFLPLPTSSSHHSLLL